MRRIALMFAIVGLYFIISGSTDVNTRTTLSNMITVYHVELDTVNIVARRIRPVVQEGEYALLARLIYCEAGHEPFDGMRAVADVVVYIAREKGWSISEVIYDDGRFDGINNYLFHKMPNRESYRAAKLAIEGHHILPYGVMFFHNPETSTDTKWVNYISQYAYKKIGNHLFCFHPLYYENNNLKKFCSSR